MDKEEALKLVEDNGFELENLSGELKKDREVVLVAVQQNGNAIHFADEQYKKDKEVVLIAINSNWSSYQFADDKLQNDKDVLNILESNEDYIKEKKLKLDYKFYISNQIMNPVKQVLDISMSPEESKELFNKFLQ